MIQTTTHIAEGLALLITQYRDKPNLAAILTAYLTQVQEIEDVAFDILAILGDIDSQVGEQLDLIGRIVGQDREGRTDAVYIQWIHARVLVNRSSGLVDELLQILELVASGNSRGYTPAYPASFLIEIFGAFSGDAQAVAAILGEARAAGVNGQFLYSVQADADTFTWATGDTEEASTTQGWGDDAQTTGGRFADVEET